MILMLLCSLAPVILLLSYVIYRDRNNAEPKRRVALGLVYGALSVIVTLLIHAFWSPLPEVLGFSWVKTVPMLRGVFTAFFEAAIPEETAKLLMLWLLLRRSQDFNENMDGIVYAVCVGLGFAGVENILYVFESESWQATAVVRFFYAVPGHYIDAVLMGFFYSFVHFQPKRYGKYRPLIWIAPVLAHGTYDAICMVADDNMTLMALSFIPLTWFCVRMHKFCFKRLDHIDRLDADKEDLALFTEAMRNEEKTNGNV